MTVDAEGLFSHTVPEAHQRFVDATARAGAEARVVPHPLQGPDGEPLHSAVARIGDPDAHTLLLSISGTHGIEGYAGSGLQIGALREGLLVPPSGVAVVFVHLVNPWGTAWSTRENEDNVELMRHHYYQHAEKPPNPIFAEFYDTMGYGTTKSLDEFMANRRNVRNLLERVSFEDLMQALVHGQDTHPDAITWTGDRPTWSKRLLDDVLDRHVLGARRVVVFDLHTAQGPWGETIIMHKRRTPDDPHRALARRWFEDDLWPDDDEISFYQWIELTRPGTEVMTLVLECGTETLGPNDQYIFPLDVWLKQHGDRQSAEAGPHVERYRRFFYPETVEWCTSVWRSGRTRWQQILQGVAHWRLET
jgi:hypothetical protein